MDEERYPALPWQGWKIVKKLGRGGYGSVYQAQRNSAGVMEDAAIKVISFPKDKEDIEADFTDGYDTIVGERGVTLSGGQKQRVAIARMLMKEAPILVFDDSLSAVDTETDNKIRKELKKEMEKATVIMISHRITSLMQADCIIVMDKGEIQQMGTHEDLIRQEGPYKDIYEIQMNSDIRLMEGGAACE